MNIGLFATLIFAFSSVSVASSSSYDASKESALALQGIFQNINSPGVRRGALIASPSTSAPNYFYHWTRDAALTMGTLIELGPNPLVNNAVRNWADFELVAQSNAAKAQGVAEPKFEVNGQVFAGPWGRPQNDGPAIRSWTYLRAFGELSPLVQTDLEYLKNHWADTTFDLWEEVRGHHFFTTYAQMVSFRTAAAVAQRVGSSAAADYSRIADQIESALGSFIDTGRSTVLPTLGGAQNLKAAGLDISVILAVVYFGPSRQWSVSQSYILSTALRMEQSFIPIYPINSAFANLAPGIGRYPEDVYDGTGFSGGHPWFLATFGMGEFYCALAQDLSARGQVNFDQVNFSFYKFNAPELQTIGINQLNSRDPQFWALLGHLRDKGESFISRALVHAGADRRYSEQFDRNTGYRRGARDLTWSYASSLRAFQRCAQTDQILRQFWRH